MTCGDNKPCSKSEVQRRNMKQEQSKNDLYKYELALISEKNNMLRHICVLDAYTAFPCLRCLAVLEPTNDPFDKTK